MQFFFNIILSKTQELSRNIVEYLYIEVSEKHELLPLKTAVEGYKFPITSSF